VIVLVTGGAGFIGSHVVDLLAREGHRVRVLDLPEKLAGPHSRHHPPSVQTIAADLRDRGAVADATAGVDSVIHNAGMVGLGRSFADVIDYVSHNDVGTAVLLEALHRWGFAGRLVLASSMVVYGEGAYACSRHGAVRPRPRTTEELRLGRFEPPCPLCKRPLSPRPVTEEAPLDPRSLYAATKLHQEHLCNVFGRESDASVIALRYHNVYGPRMPRDTPYAGVAAIFRRSLVRGEAPRVTEDGCQLRDFLHVSDAARASVAALAAPAPGAYNVASGVPRSVGELAAALTDLFGPDAPAPVVTGDYRLGDVRHVFGSPAKAGAVLGWEAKVSFEAGLRELAPARR
jgi:dTDP-L-rhamnose 4-epimerase